MNSIDPTVLPQVVIGLGKTGLSCVRHLSEAGFKVAVTDNRASPPGLEEVVKQFPEVKLSIGQFDRDLCLHAARIVLSPGVSLQEPVIAEALCAGIPVIGDVELFALLAKAPIVGITGSNGKSTVTTLLGEMGKTAAIDVCIGGNLGEPVLDLLQHPVPTVYALELSSFQLETTFSLRPLSAVILNLCEDHMDRYNNSMIDYLHAKQRIYMDCQYPVVNRDDPITFESLYPAPSSGVGIKPLSFGLDTPPTDNDFGLITRENIVYFAKGETTLMPVSEMKMKGKPHMANALAALALGTVIGLPQMAMLQTLRVFPGLAHRCQWVAKINGVDWYNDSKATNVGAAQAAITGLGHEICPAPSKTMGMGKLVVIAGGQGKGADFSPLREVMPYVKQLILMGIDAPLIEAALAGAVPISHASSLGQAVISAHQIAVTGDSVVLAPACASFDMFKNFENRGEIYVEAVAGLAAKTPP
jgi:UDP-N-acetylmuramoylalanine--D-glutamate ligase